MNQLIKLFQSGGIMMYPLFLASVFAVAVILERFWTLFSISSSGKKAMPEIEPLIKAQRWDEAMRILELQTGPVSKTLIAGLGERKKGKEGMELAMEEAARESFPLLRRYLPVLDTVITAAPLLGLLGTITGLMGVFRVVADKLSRNPHADTSGITGGIAESLIATATGISIAVVALVFYNFFTSLTESIIAETEKQATHLIRLVTHSSAGISTVLADTQFTEEKGTVR